MCNATGNQSQPFDTVGARIPPCHFQVIKKLNEPGTGFCEG